MAAIVQALSTKDLHSFQCGIRFHNLATPLETLPFHQMVLRDAIALIRESLRPGLRTTSERQSVLPLKGRSARRAIQSVDVIGEAKERRRNLEGSSRLSPLEAKNRVDKQIAGIASEFFCGREDLAEKYITDLVNFQFSNSEQEHLAKSLCNLAATAIDANRLEMAERLSRYAIDLGISDPVVFTTRAEVLKNLGNFAASLEAFREARLRFPHSEYAWVGIADVLNEMGRHESSLAAVQ